MSCHGFGKHLLKYSLRTDDIQRGIHTAHKKKYRCSFNCTIVGVVLYFDPALKILLDIQKNFPRDSEWKKVRMLMGRGLPLLCAHFHLENIFLS